MKILDHWHPVLKSKALKDKAVEREIASRKIVLFRQNNGKAAAINHRCPHRGMNLSLGKIENNHLVCPYHGWQFDSQGNGKSPCNPSMKIKTDFCHIKEAYGYIWITENPDAGFPEFGINGFDIINVLHRKANAPLEHVVDNFHEFEHFPRAHQRIGYDFKQIEEADIKISSFTDLMKIEFYPQENIYPLVRKIFRLPDNSKYFMNILVHFSPLYSVYHQGWINPANGEKNSILINVVFFVPINKDQTDIVMFLMTKKARLKIIKNLFISKMSEAVIDDDLKILNNLAGKEMGMEDMRLGSYDKAIIEIRKRIIEIYRKNDIV